MRIWNGLPLILLTVFLLITRAHADCESFDLSEVMMKVPPRKQGTMGTCYAQVTSQLVEASRIFEGQEPQQVSPIDIAFLSHANLSAEDWKIEYEHYSDGGMGYYFPFEGGSTCHAFLSAQQRGVCLKEDVEKMIGNSRDLQSRLDEMASYYSSLGYASFRQMNDPSDRATSRVFRCSSPQAIEARLGLPKDFLQGPGLDLPRLAMHEALTQKCRERGRVTVPGNLTCEDVSIESLDLDSKRRNIEAYWKSTEGQAIPMAVALCGKLLKHGASFRGLNSEGQVTENCGKHAMLLVGREMRNGKCMVRLRNAQGATCGPSQVWECDGNGSYWVEEEAFLNNVYRLSQIRRTEIKRE